MLTMLEDLKKNMKIKEEWYGRYIKKRPKWRYSYSKLDSAKENIVNLKP